MREKETAREQDREKAHINNGVSLNVVHVGVAKAQLFATSLCGADDPRGNGVLEGKWATNGNDEFSWSQVSRSPQHQHRQLFL